MLMPEGKLFFESVDSKMLVTIDGPMINRFIDDVDCFRKCADDRFRELDGDGDGFLSRNDLRQRFSSSLAFDPAPLPEKEIDFIFGRFDVDRNGLIDREEFRPMVMEILIAVARGIGPTPVNVGAEKDSLLLKVFEHDQLRALRKLASRRRNGITGKVLRKKKSIKMMRIFSCSC